MTTGIIALVLVALIVWVRFGTKVTLSLMVVAITVASIYLYSNAYIRDSARETVMENME